MRLVLGEGRAAMKRMGLRGSISPEGTKARGMNECDHEFRHTERNPYRVICDDCQEECFPRSYWGDDWSAEAAAVEEEFEWEQKSIEIEAMLAVSPELELTV